MKNRRNIIVAFLLCACLIVGIGYAALTDTLRIDGTAKLSHSAANAEFDGKVQFVSCEPANDADTAELSADKDIYTLTVNSLTVKDSTATFKFVISSTYHEKIYINPHIVASDAYDATLIGLSSTWEGKWHEVAASEDGTAVTIEYELTVKCLQSISSDTTTRFNINFAATDVMPTGEGVVIVPYPTQG